jgi:protein AbiQ
VGAIKSNGELITHHFFVLRRKMKIQIFTIDTAYIEFLRTFPKLSIVYQNHDRPFDHGRKYVGIVMQINNQNYYAPFSSPKKADYFDKSKEKIRPSIIPIIRMVEKNKNSSSCSLLGTIRLSNMIPVPIQVVHKYEINQENDVNYRNLVQKEYLFIEHNQHLIEANAATIYRQKVNPQIFELHGKKQPNYLNSTIDFKYAEKISDLYNLENH